MRDGAVVPTHRCRPHSGEVVTAHRRPHPGAAATTLHRPYRQSRSGWTRWSGERFGPVSLSVRAGEVVGLVGLAGAGHVELGRTVLGAPAPLRRPDCELHDKPYAPAHVPAAVASRDGLRDQQPRRGGPRDAADAHREPTSQPGGRPARGPLRFRRNAAERRIAAADRDLRRPAEVFRTYRSPACPEATSRRSFSAGGCPPTPTC